MSRNSHSCKSRARNLPYRPKRARPGVSRAPLSPEDVKQLAAAMRKAYGWDADPKGFQLEAVKAQIEGVDMIVQAPTGAGKTALAAGPHLWKGFETRVTLMICPLLSLEEEMVKTFQNDFGLKAIALNSKNGACSPEKVYKILALEYQVVIVSPEMLQSRTFINRILRNPSFVRNIISMFIDEAHCIVHWGADFRKNYGTIGKMRAFLPRGCPVIAVTATLTARVRRSIYASLHFAQSERPSRFLNEGNDRPNVSIVVRACEHPLNSYGDLDFIMPTTVRSATDIPKTYLYVDNIAIGGEIIDYLNSRLLERVPDGTTALPQGLIRPFNATLSQEYRTNAMAHFRAGNIRILVCTDAAGMGCNILDIDLVVQWKLPATFSNFIQRAGRAARGRNRTGVAVLLVEKSAYSTDLVSQPAPSIGMQEAKNKKDTTTANGTKGDVKANRDYARAHGVERGSTKRLDGLPDGIQPHLNPDAGDEGLLTFVQSTTCRRKIWATAFESFTLEKHIPCCDICDPTLLDRTRPKTRSIVGPTKNPKHGLPDLRAQEKLYQWRVGTLARDFPLAQFDDTAILDDDLIRNLVSCGPLSVDQIRKALEEKWVFWCAYGEDLTKYIHSLDISFTPLPKKPRTRKRDISSVDMASRDSTKRPKHADASQIAPAVSTEAPAPQRAPVVHVSAANYHPVPPLSPSRSPSSHSHYPIAHARLHGMHEVVLTGTMQRPTYPDLTRGPTFPSASVAVAVRPSLAIPFPDMLHMYAPPSAPSLSPPGQQLAHLMPNSHTLPQPFYSTQGSNGSELRRYVTNIRAPIPESRIPMPAATPPYTLPYLPSHSPYAAWNNSPLSSLSRPAHHQYPMPPPTPSSSGSVSVQSLQQPYQTQFPPY